MDFRNTIAKEPRPKLQCPGPLAPRSKQRERFVNYIIGRQ
jgi:hypothetical protein